MSSYHPFRPSEFALLKGLVLSLLCLHLLEGQGSHTSLPPHTDDTEIWLSGWALSYKPPSAKITYHKGNTPFPPLYSPKLLNPWHPCPCQELGSHLQSPHHPSWGYNPQQVYTPTSLCSHSYPIYSHSLQLSFTSLCWVTMMASSYGLSMAWIDP